MKLSNKFRLLLFAFVLCLTPLASFAQAISIGISIRTAPPPLPVYVQPPCPAEGYLWTPGYWSYDPAGYYWVPGVWVRPPRVGVLWTPGYWALAGGIYGWHPGYWGPRVGFYGGVNYGFGYTGAGFFGGMWQGGVYRYNTAVANVNTTVIHNTYINRTVVNNTVVNNRASFNGPGGIDARPTPQQQQALRQQHFQATSEQLSHQQTASRDRSQFASANRGAPVTTGMNTVNGRRYNQQGRIANGIASGQLNARQASRLENRQANVNQGIRADRQANGGRLTPEERQNVNRQENRDSQHIRDDKHREDDRAR